MVATQQHNCTSTPLVLKKTEHFAIMTSKGVIEEAKIMTFKLESKEKFIEESHKIRQIPGYDKEVFEAIEPFFQIVK